MQRFFDMSVDLLTVTDFEAHVLDVSQSWERALGWSPEEVVGRVIFDLFHPDDVPGAMAAMERLLDGEDALGVPARVRTKDGVYRWFQANARADLERRRVYVNATDITERKDLEEALRRQLHLEELVASAASRLIGAEREHVRDEIERSMAELAQAMGADRAHFMRGQRDPDRTTYVEWRNPETVSQRHTPAAAEDVQQWWRDLLRSGRVLRLDDVDDLAAEAPHVVAALRDDGVRSVLHVPLPIHRRHWGFLTMVAVRSPVRFSDDATALLRLAGECFMTALAERDDARALQEARRELERRNEELERVNEGLADFAYAAAHDLKAPLSRVEMALAAAPVEDGTTAELLGIAQRATARMRQLIEDLLAFASAGATGPMGPVDLDDALTQVLSDLEPLTAATGVQIDRSPLPEAVGYRPLLEQLLLNLVGNAVKFTRSGVRPLVQVEGTERNRGVLLTVRDNGIGIEPEHRDEVFGVFTRLNPSDAFAGSGIGLATCAKVVQQHRGRIWIEDGIDGGVSVCVWLPNTPASSDHAEADGA
jgi:PAS domain S-box-containing protein